MRLSFRNRFVEIHEGSCHERPGGEFGGCIIFSEPLGGTEFTFFKSLPLAFEIAEQGALLFVIGWACQEAPEEIGDNSFCLLYTSDAADE